MNNQSASNMENAFRITQQMIVPKAVKQRHIDGLIVFTGLAADRPADGKSVKVFFATDTGVLSIWNGTAWKSVTLS